MGKLQKRRVCLFLFKLLFYLSPVAADGRHRVAMMIRRRAPEAVEVLSLSDTDRCRGAEQEVAPCWLTGGSQSCLMGCLLIRAPFCLYLSVWSFRGGKKKKRQFKK